MKRLLALAMLVGLVVVGVTTSSVLAKSGKTTATYWSNAIGASSFQPGTGVGTVRPNAPDGWYWLGYEKSATWTFDVSSMSALTGSPALNLKGFSTSIQASGGAGFDTTIRVVVTGVGSSTLTTTLNNPWQPHVAYNANPPSGWEGAASVLVPTSVWKGASTLTVKVTALTSNTMMGVNEDSLLLGYTTIG